MHLNVSLLHYCTGHWASSCSPCPKDAGITKTAQNRHTKTGTAQNFFWGVLGLSFHYFGALPKTETAQKPKNRPMLSPNY